MILLCKRQRDVGEIEAALILNDAILARYLMSTCHEILKMIFIFSSLPTNLRGQ